MLAVFFSLLSISCEGGGPHRERGFQFGFDGVGGDFVVPEDEALSLGIVVLSLNAEFGIGVFGESGAWKLQDFFSLFGAEGLGG